MDTNINDLNQNNALHIDEHLQSILIGASKWARYLAILGFIGLGFSIFIGFIMMLFMGSAAGPGRYPDIFELISGGLIGAIYLIMAAVYFFPVLYLYRFADNLKKALIYNDQEKLRSAFSFLRKHYRFIGIMTIAIFGLYFLLILAITFSNVASL